MKNIYKIISFFIALCLLAGCAAPLPQNSTPAAPGQPQESAPAQQEQQPAPEQPTGSAAPTLRTAGLPIYDVTTTLLPNVKNGTVAATESRLFGLDDEDRLYSMAFDGSDVQQLSFERQQTGTRLSGPVAGADGYLYLVEQLGRRDNEYHYYLHRLTPDGGEQTGFAFALHEDVYLQFSSMGVSANGAIYIPANGDLFLLTADGQARLMPIDNTVTGYYRRITALADGRVYAYTQCADLGYYCFTQLLPDGTEAGRTPIDSEATLVTDGADALYLNDLQGIHSFDISTGETRLLCGWMDSGLNYSEQVGFVHALADGSFIVTDKTEDGLLLQHLTKADPAALPEKTVLTLGYMPRYDFRQDILDFNKTSDSLHISVWDYAVYQNSPVPGQSAEEMLLQDMQNGSGPDILLTYQAPTLQPLARQGLLADLGPLLDADDSVGRGDLMPNILAACEDDGSLYTLIPYYYVQTLAGAARLVGQGQNWTWDEFFALLQEDPRIHTSQHWMEPAHVLRTLLNCSGTQFVDTVAGRAHLDSPDFVRLLQAIDRFQYDTTDDDSDDEPADRLLYDVTLAASFSTGSLIQLFDGAFTLKNLPGTDGAVIVPRFQLAISESCPDKDAAWEFVSLFLTPEMQSKNYGLPLRTQQLEKEIPWQQDLAVIRSASTLQPDQALLRTVQESVTPFFDGDITAEEAAAAAQAAATAWFAGTS